MALQGIPTQVGSQGTGETQHALLGSQRVSVHHFVGALTRRDCCEGCGELGKLGQ